MSIENDPISEEQRIAYMNALFDKDGLSFEDFLKWQKAEEAKADNIAAFKKRRKAKTERRYARRQKLRKLMKWR